MFLILPLSTSSSSFCQVGYGSAVRSSSITLLPSFLNAIGLVGNQQNAQADEIYRPVDQVQVEIVGTKHGKRLV
jgi:hypothetical protein